jgi:hypothetical protein
MKGARGLKRSITVTSTLCLLLVSMVPAAKPRRLELYDGFDNFLMFVTFEYNESGVNTRRTVYMADSTFVRDVLINYDANNQRANEVSYDFNKDTSFVTAYQHNGNVTSFSVRDQFNLDHVGGMVSYIQDPNQLNYTLQYNETGGQAATMAYTKDAEGNLTQVVITDQSGKEQYIGKFFNDDVGVAEQLVHKGQLKSVAISQRGASMLDLRINLHNAGDVRCDLMTLSGRRVQQLFNGKLKAGYHSRHFRISNSTSGSVSNGVYLVIVSVNGVNVLQERYLHQHAVGGVQ